MECGNFCKLPHGFFTPDAPKLHNPIKPPSDEGGAPQGRRERKLPLVRFADKGSHEWRGIDAISKDPPGDISHWEDSLFYETPPSGVGGFFIVFRK